MYDVSPKAFTHAEVVHMVSAIDSALDGSAADRIWTLGHIRSFLTDPDYNGATNLSTDRTKEGQDDGD